MQNRSFVLLAVLLFLLVSSCTSVDKYIYSNEVLEWETDIHAFDSLNALEYSDQGTLLVTGSSSVRL